MNDEQYTAAEFVRGVTWAPTMTSRVLIGGVHYEVGDMLTDMIVDEENKWGTNDYRNEIFATLARVARSGDVAAQDLIRRMGETFAYKHCPPEPEPEDIPEPITLGRSDGALPVWMTREGATA